MRKPISIIKFRLRDNGKVFTLNKREIGIVFLILLCIWSTAKIIPWILFIPTFLIVSVIVIFFRPKPKFEMTTERWDKISKGDGPFIYESDGFYAKMLSNPKHKIKWTDIKQVVAYRSGYIPNDQIGLYVLIDSGLQITVPEMSDGCFNFFEKIKENLDVTDNKWLANITSGNDRQIIYERQETQLLTSV